MLKHKRIGGGSNHVFSQVPSVNVPRSAFNRSHTYKTTFDAGYLVPVFIDEALPGDTFNVAMTTFARLATPVAPVMDNMYCDVFFFAVPMRLVWSNWQRFNGEQDTPEDSVDFEIPTMDAPAVTGHAVGSLSDYFGIPTGVAGLEHSSLWHRAYNLVYNEWFKDENLQDDLVVDLDDGPDDPADYVLARRGKRHDYFTSCLPWPQKGASIALPLGTHAPVSTYAGTSDDITVWRKDTENYAKLYAAGTFVQQDNTPGAEAKRLFTDLSEATAATINELREAFQLQKMLERDARGGTRYTEIVRSHFGVVSPDARLQRPEFLGGGSTYVNLSPIPQTSSTDGTSPQGNLAAMGTFSHSGIGFKKSFTEHCLLIGLVNVRADMTYQQGLNRMFSRVSRYDFYWPSLAHLGEQAVLSKEIYADGTAGDEDVFGYQERYAEYRYKPSVITGKFRSTAAGSLDVWHLAQEFSSRPELDATFMVENPPVERVIAVETEPHFLFDAHFNMKCVRPMPTYSVPGLIDHF